MFTHSYVYNNILQFISITTPLLCWYTWTSSTSSKSFTIDWCRSSFCSFNSLLEKSIMCDTFLFSLIELIEKKKERNSLVDDFPRKEKRWKFSAMENNGVLIMHHNILEIYLLFFLRWVSLFEPILSCFSSSVTTLSGISIWFTITFSNLRGSLLGKYLINTVRTSP